MKILYVCLFVLILLSIVCPASAQTCLTSADTDCSGDVNLTEVMDYIVLWYGCSSCYSELFQVIEAYFGILPPPGPSFPDDYVSWWKFDGNANDEKGRNNGSLVGNATTVYDAEREYSGTTGGVLKLDGNGDYVSVADNDSLDVINNNLTISLWMKTSSIPDYPSPGGLFTKGGVGGKGYRFSLSYSGRSMYILFHNGASYTHWGPGFDYNDGEWHHLVLVVDKDNELSFYADGSSLGSRSLIAGDFETVRNLNIGGGSYETLEGEMDDVMIFNRKLSEWEIQKIYESQKYYCTGKNKCSDYGDYDSCAGNPCKVDTDCQWDGSNCVKSGRDTWYVRPSGGTYGNEDGSSYQDAWDGLDSLSWDNIDAGDTIYICGLHLGSYTGTSTGFDFNIRADGLDENSRVAIRGDCHGDQGVIWNTGIMAHENWVYEGNNVWSISSAPYGGYFEDITKSSWTVLSRISNRAKLTGNWTFNHGDINVVSVGNGDASNELEAGDYVYGAGRWYEVAGIIDANSIILTSPYQGSTYTSGNGTVTREDFSASISDVENTPGSYYNPYNIGHTKLYVHTSDSGDPTNRIAAYRYGYNIKLKDTHYITLKNLELYAMYRPLNVLNPPAEYATYIRFENVTYWYDGLRFRENSHHIEFIDCDMGYAGFGIATGDNHAASTDDAPHHITVRGCKIHDITGNPDSEGIGAQGTSHWLIENNEFYRVGSGICFYTWSSQEEKNNTIRWNWVHDTHADCYSDGRCSRDRGIELNHDASHKDSTGNRVYGNIVGPGVDNVGYRYNYMDEGEFYNNICYGCGISFYANHGLHGIRAKLRNLISLNPLSYHLVFAPRADEGNYSIDSDYNLFWPEQGGQFKFFDANGGFNHLNFTEWQSLIRENCTFDTHSIIADPMFVSSDPGVPEDFRLKTGSPAIDAGIDLGEFFNQDYEGNIRPLDGDSNGSAEWDIGAYEYFP